MSRPVMLPKRRSRRLAICIALGWGLLVVASSLVECINPQLTQPLNSSHPLFQASRLMTSHKSGGSSSSNTQTLQNVPPANRSSSNSQKFDFKQQVPRNTTSNVSTRKPTPISGASAGSPVTSARQRWRQMELAIGLQINSFTQQLRVTLDELPVGSRAQVSTGCRSTLDELADGLQEQRLWASQMVDASARLPSGLLSGTLTELGNYDQCLRLSYRSASDGQVPVRGQYCSLQVKPPLFPRPRWHTVCQRLPPISSSQLATNQTSNKMAVVFKLLGDHSQNFYYAGLRLGVCTPSKCSRSDIQLLLSAYLSKFELIGQVKSCQVLTPNEKEALAEDQQGSTSEFQLDSLQQCIALAFIVLTLLVAVGTLVDYASQRAVTQPVPMQTSVASLAMARKASSDSGLTSFGPPDSTYATKPSLDGRAQEHRAPGARRWMYQVYRPARSTCQLHPSSQRREPGLQRNPLAHHPIQCQIGQVNGQFTTLNSCSHLFEDQTNDTAEEASWLVNLDRSNSSNSRRHSLTPSQVISSKQNAGGRNPISSAARLLVCFSLRLNLKNILGNRRAPKQKMTSLPVWPPEVGVDLGAIHGLRTIAMIWIVFGHSVGLANPDMMNNLFSVAQLSCSSRILQALLNATLAVNTFYMVSGLVTVISLARKCPSAWRRLTSLPSEAFAMADEPVGAGPPATGAATAAATTSSAIGATMGQRQPHSRHRGGKHQSEHSKKIRDKHEKSRRNNRSKKELSSSSACDSSASSSASIISSSLNSSSLSCASDRCIGPSAGSSSRRRNNTSHSRGASSEDFKPLAWLLMRYFKLVPAYAAVLAASILLPAMGSGPFWQETAGSLGATCRENWWTNLLYVNNFINTDRICLIHSWYLSNDLLFYTLTLILLAIFYKSRRVALLLLVTCIAASSAITFALTVAYEFPPTIVATSPPMATPERWLFLHTLYYKPWPHLPSYLVGTITGYLLLQPKREARGDKPEVMNPFANYFAWLLCSLLALALVNSVYPWNMGLEVDPMLSGLHSATFRTLWASCCAWLVYKLATAPTKNWLAKLLSWHGFQVSSRLTYCLYLVHPLIIYNHYGSLRERLDSSIYGQFHRFVSILCLSFLAALSLALIVEGPALKLLQMLCNALGIPLSAIPGSQSGVEDDGHGKFYHGSNQSNGSSPGTDSSWGSSSASFTGGQLHTSYGMMRSATSGAGFIEPTEVCSDAGAHHAVSANFEHAELARHQAPGMAGRVLLMDEGQGKQGTVASFDADFQRKLAQAISRGFRVRSRLANNATSQATMNAAARRANPAASKWPMAPVSPITEPIIQQQQQQLHHQPADKGQRKKVEFSTFIIPGSNDVAMNQQQMYNTFTSAAGNQKSQSVLIESGHQSRRRSHQDLMMSPSCQSPLQKQQQQQAPNLASLNHQILAQHQKLLSRSKDQF